jgi:hypothetical protein
MYICLFNIAVRLPIFMSGTTISATVLPTELATDPAVALQDPSVLRGSGAERTSDELPTDIPHEPSDTGRIELNVDIFFSSKK